MLNYVKQIFKKHNNLVNELMSYGKKHSVKHIKNNKNGQKYYYRVFRK